MGNYRGKKDSWQDLLDGIAACYLIMGFIFARAALFNRSSSLGFSAGLGLFGRPQWFGLFCQQIIKCVLWWQRPSDLLDARFGVTAGAPSGSEKCNWVHRSDKVKRRLTGRPRTCSWTAAPMIICCRTITGTSMAIVFRLIIYKGIWVPPCRCI